jgi:hypothetical protein
MTAQATSFFMANMNPVDTAITAQGIIEEIQTVASDTINSTDTSSLEHFDQLLGNGAAHGILLMIKDIVKNNFQKMD